MNILSFIKIPVVRLCLIFLLAIQIVLLTGCKEKESPQPAAVEVVVARVIQQNIPIYSDFVGQTEASLYVDIRARVEGFLEDELFDEGTMVKEKQLLYKIDSRPYMARVNRLKAEVERFEALRSQAERNLARIKPLYEQNAASQKDHDEAITDFEESKANLSIANASLEEAKLELDYTSIYSPLAGLIGESRVHIGSVVGPGSESLLTRVQKTDPIHVRFSMTALEYLEFRRRAEKRGKIPELASQWESVSITLPDGTDYKWKGEVKFKDPQVNPQTGTFAIRAVIPNPELTLRPGQYTRVRLRMGWIPNAMLIPQQALQFEQGGVSISLVDNDGKVQKRFVEIGDDWKELVLIEEGLSGDENVIIEGMHKVRPGMKVKTVTKSIPSESVIKP